jgi:hypothetical protein
MCDDKPVKMGGFLNFFINHHHVVNLNMRLGRLKKSTDTTSMFSSGEVTGGWIVGLDSTAPF